MQVVGLQKAGYSVRHNNNKFVIIHTMSSSVSTVTLRLIPATILTPANTRFRCVLRCRSSKFNTLSASLCRTAVMSKPPADYGKYKLHTIADKVLNIYMIDGTVTQDAQLETMSSFSTCSVSVSEYMPL